MKNKIPLHQQISEDILIKILNKEYPVNEMIPKELELAENYNVSRPTIRQAIKTLVDKGYLERIKGTGTFVRNKKINQNFTNTIRSYNEEMKEKGIIPKTKIINFSIQKANSVVSEKLNIKLGDPVYSLTRLRYAGDEPILFVTSYIPQYIYPDLINEDFTKVSLYDTFSKYENPIFTAKRTLSVIKSDNMSSPLLNIPTGEPLFYFETIGYTITEREIEYSTAWYRGDYNTFEFIATV